MRCRRDYSCHIVYTYFDLILLLLFVSIYLIEQFRYIVQAEVKDEKS